MLDVIKNLLALQERDRKLMRVREELSRIPPDRQALTTGAASAQSKLDSGRDRALHIESDRKKLELDVEAQKLQIEKYSLQQFQTRKNEEYRALAHEIETCKGNISGLEDQILELMEQTDVTRQAIATATQEANEVKKLVDGKLADLAQRESELLAERAALETGRNELAARVDDTVRNRYERLFKSKGNNVVVGIERGVCGGCHMTLQRQVVVSCQADAEVVACPNCGRILYFTPNMDTTTVD
jgi:predicted  nucleic acid-binding Zn-ribbon protein